MSVKERVERGAKLLDEHRPGWELKIDLQALDLSSCDRCVLGQIYGSYGDGYDLLGLTDETSPYGFDRELSRQASFISLERLCQDIKEDWKALREEWTSLIKDRLDQGITL
jgi:hypothetical protein